MEAALSGVSAYPICEMCKQPIEVVKEIHVDHIRPFDGVNDPLRLDRDNLRVVHMRCHMRHTAKVRHKGGVVPSLGGNG